MTSYVDYASPEKRDRGMITVTERGPSNKHGYVQWFVSCSCGQEGVLLSSNALAKGQEHCGCQFSESYKKRNETYKRRKEGLPPIGTDKHSQFRHVNKLHSIIDQFLYTYRGIHGTQMRSDSRYEPLQQACALSDAALGPETQDTKIHL